MRSTLLAAALLAVPAWSFKDTSPLLIWSSNSDESLRGAQSEVSSGVIAAEEIYGTISTLGCDWETLVIGHAEGLHNSRVSSLRLPSSAADLHIPYLLRPSRETLDSAVSEWAQLCGAETTNNVADVKDGKNVLSIDIKEGQDIDSILKTLPSPHILIITGSHSLSKRQEAPLPSDTRRPTRPSSTHSSTSAPNNGTIKDGHLLDRVQLLTTPIITGLLVVFFLLLPILYVGIYALVGIQVPPRMLEIGKGLTVDKQRKDQ